MPDPLIYKGVQFGRQTLYGTAVAAVFKSLGLKFTPKETRPSEVVDASGQRGDVDVINGKASSGLDFSGKLAMVDSAFMFAAALGRVGIAGNVLTVSMDQEVLQPYLYSLEYGNGVSSLGFPDSRVTDLTVGLAPNAAPTLSGSIIGGAISDPGPWTPGTVALPIQHGGPRSQSIWVATTAAGLTSAPNQLDCPKQLVDFQFAIQGLAENFFAICEGDGPSETTDLKPNIGANVTVLKSSSLAATWNAALTNGDLLFCRILVKGPTVSAVQSTIDIRFPFKIVDPGFGENQNSLARTFRFQAVYDATLGTAIQAAFTGAWVSSIFTGGGGSAPWLES